MSWQHLKLMKHLVDPGDLNSTQKLTLGLTSRVAAAAEDARRLADVAGGRLAPAAAAVGALAAVVFLSGAEAAEVVGRLAGAAVLLGRVLAAAVGLVALVEGCHTGGPGRTGGVGSEMKRDCKRKEKKIIRK